MTNSMILDSESWMNVRRFRALHEAGASYAEIAAECGVDWRTAKKYLQQPLGATPPAASSRKGTQPRVIEAYAAVVDAMLRRNIRIKASVIHERLVAEHGFTHSYQRVKMYVAEARPRIAAETGALDTPLAGLHRRFEVIPGAQAQVDWGDEGAILAHVGIERVYSFHMVLSWSRDPFICYTASSDLVTFFDCHRRAFAHFGGVPAMIVYDRTKTVVKRHVAPGAAVPLHPEAAAFAEHYGFVIDVLAAYRATGKGRVERQVDVGRAHVLTGRGFDSLAQMDAAFTAWVPIRHAQVHRTHGERIGERAVIERAALKALPELPYLVAEAHLRRVGKDCLVWFEASLYSVPARLVRPAQRVAVRAGADTVTITALSTDGGGLLAVHPRARKRGQWMLNESHWDGLPDGHTRATIVESAHQPSRTRRITDAGADVLAALLALNPAAAAPVAQRSLRDYERAAGVDGTLPDPGVHW
jgi:transposase